MARTSPTKSQTDLITTRTPWLLLGLSRSSWYRLLSAHKAPAPIRLGGTGPNLWRVADLVKWVDKQRASYSHIGEGVGHGRVPLILRGTTGETMPPALVHHLREHPPDPLDTLERARLRGGDEGFGEFLAELLGPDLGARALGDYLRRREEVSR